MRTIKAVIEAVVADVATELEAVVADVATELCRFLNEKEDQELGTAVDEIVVNDTPLPKPHGRLIDADKLIDSILADRQSFYTQSEMISAVNYAPIIITKEASKST